MKFHSLRVFVGKKRDRPDAETRGDSAPPPDRGSGRVPKAPRVPSTDRPEPGGAGVQGTALDGAIATADRPRVAVDGKGRILEANQAAAHIVNRSSAQLIQSSVVDSFYAGTRGLAGAVRHALQACAPQPLRDHFTYVSYAPTEDKDEEDVPERERAKPRPAADDSPYQDQLICVPGRLEARQLPIEGQDRSGSIGVFQPLLNPLPTAIRSFGDATDFAFTVDPVILDLLVEAEDARDRCVLILGERGSGKELLARYLHDFRDRGPFIRVHCAGLADDELAEELFGCVKDWNRRPERKGKLAEGQNGTVLLDELSYVPLDIQRRLLRVLDSQTVIPMGGSENGTVVKFRFVAATRSSRSELKNEQMFLPELLDRLVAGSAMSLPPFRERPGDIVLSAVSMLEQNRALNREAWPRGLDSRVIEILWRYRWPGGLRQLRGCIHTASARWRSEYGAVPAVGRKRGTPVTSLLDWTHLPAHLVEDALSDPYPQCEMPPLDHVEARRHLASRTRQRIERLRRVHAAAGSDTVKTRIRVRQLLLKFPHLRRLSDGGAKKLADILERATHGELNSGTIQNIMPSLKQDGDVVDPPKPRGAAG